MKKMVILCAALVVVATSGLLSGATDTAGTHVKWAAEDIVGMVLFPDGETPVASLPVRIWNTDTKKMVYRSETDAQGVFKVPALDVGHCFIFIGRVKIDMQILKARAVTMQQSHDIIVVLPRPMLVTSSSSSLSSMMDVLIAPLIMQPPDAPKVVSP